MITAATANATPLHRSSSDGDDRDESWLFDIDGNAVELPDDCAGFQIRRVIGKARGLGEIVLDEETGLPAHLERGCSVDDVYAAVAYVEGRYQLCALDGRRRRLDVALARVTVTAAVAARQGALRDGGAAAPRTSPQAPAAKPTTDEFLIRMVQMQEKTVDTFATMLDRVLTKHTALLAGHVVTAPADVASVAGDSTAAPMTSTPPSMAAPAPRNARNAEAAPAPAAGPTLASEPNSARSDDADDGLSLVGMARAIEPVLNSPMGKIVAASLGKACGLSSDEVTNAIGDASKTAAPPTLPVSSSEEDDEDENDDDQGDDDEGDDANDDNAAAATATAKTPPLTGAALAEHITMIQSQLTSDEQHSLMKFGLRFMGQFEMVKRVIGTMPLEHAVSTIRKLLAVWKSVGAAEHNFMGSMIERGEKSFRNLLDAIASNTVERAVELIRSTVRDAATPPKRAA